MTLRDTSSKRIFAGLPLPAKSAQELCGWIETWKDRLTEWNPVKSKILHITLHFFGDTPIAEVERLSERMDRLQGSPIRASLSEVGCFPERGTPRVLFVGIGEGLEELKGLYKRFHELIRTLGYREDRRGFVPHITVARKRYGGGKRNRHPKENQQRLRGGAHEIDAQDHDFLELAPGLKEPFALDRLILYESLLKTEGAEYIPLKQVTLQ
jgi:2'-5' RNA ligase